MASIPSIDAAAPVPPTTMPNDPRSAVYNDDNFMMFRFKVEPCEKTYRHDWWACPYVHPGESAKRRDPRHFKYCAVACPNAKQGGHCPRGDKCPGTHSVFEYWLHPSRFRTQFCDRGIHCNQAFCFFAHTVEQLRMPSPNDYIDDSQSPQSSHNTPCANGSFEKRASFSGSTPSMSCGRHTTRGYFKSTSFDGISPRFARLPEIHNSVFSGSQSSRLPERHYPDLHSFDGVPRRDPPRGQVLYRKTGNEQGVKERRTLSGSRTFSERGPHSMPHGLAPSSAGVTPRENGDAHLRSLSFVEDFGVLQEILERISSPSNPVAQRPAVHPITPPVWNPSYTNLGSPNSTLVTQGVQVTRNHDPKMVSATADIEGAMSQLGLGLVSTPLGLSS